MPEAQAAHGPPFGPKCPGLHTQAVKIVFCAREVVFPVHCAGDPDLRIQKVSAGQMPQAVSAMLPKLELDFPAGHNVQVLSKVAQEDVEYVPCGHRTQVVSLLEPGDPEYLP